MSCLSTPLRFLPVLPREVQLSTVLKSGQSFRWQRSPIHATRSPTTAAEEDGEEWSFGWGDRTVVLRQDDQGIHYRSLYPFKPPHTAYLADLASDTTRLQLVDYFQLSTPLAPLYEQWSTADPKFARKIQVDDETDGKLRGIRVLKQDEWETLVSFICSANNNIARITLMCNRLCAQLGDPLPHPSHFSPETVYSSPFELDLVSTSPPPPNDLSLYSFPPPSALTDIPKTESLLRQLGFGYRANFIPTSALHLVETAKSLNKTPIEYLKTLRRDRYKEEEAGERLKEVREKLLEFKGVGRKVADCVMLFGLGWSQVVPVDTHVFQIAIRDYGFPASKTTSLTPLLQDKVSEHLAKKWKPHGGWCQQVLFFADLKPASNAGTPSPTKRKEVTYTKIEIKEEQEEEEGEGERKKSFEEEVREIMENPGRKRRRVTLLKAEKIEVKEEGEED
ncbi:8-oxoguanine glycosylase OGG1 [Sporobolomyces salmoneus]|uniref:8-oxoguanine glycosylase OGG1 n=1 Tax=Sporobolomyces salmoneus TaxID=183962 RepID=UPI003176DBD9